MKHVYVDARNAEGCRSTSWMEGNSTKYVRINTTSFRYRFAICSYLLEKAKIFWLEPIN
jgi:hypothetical protein